MDPASAAQYALWKKAVTRTFDWGGVRARWGACRPPPWLVMVVGGYATYHLLHGGYHLNDRGRHRLA